MSKCIAVLTKGYNNEDEYIKLITRNKHISNNLNEKSVDILIFHEGNIRENHQIFIKSKTPELNMQFINISNIAFNSDKKNIEVEEGHRFGIGYRHMCAFWFLYFFDAVKKYDKVLRIDEDCYIDSNIDKIFLLLDNYLFVCGDISVDDDSVTKGLNKFSLDFLNCHKEGFIFKTNIAKEPSGPYTNLIGFSLNKIINNDLFQKYRDDLDKSDMIYKRRWGDLPLWGEAIYYIFGEDSLMVDNTIKYFHESHNAYVNFY